MTAAPFIAAEGQITGPNGAPFLARGIGVIDGTINSQTAGQILSELPQDVLSTSTLQFGGNSGLPQASDNVTFESSDELSYIPAGSGHRFKLGALVNHVQNDQDFTANRLGTFTYNSLTDFVENHPSQYTRTLTPTQRNAQSVNAALYGGDTWRMTPALQLTYGRRTCLGSASALMRSVRS